MTDRNAKAYYDAREHFRGVFDARGRQHGLKATSRPAVSAWIRRQRAELSKLLGLHLMHPAPARPRMTGAVDCGDYIREHWLIDTARAITVPFYLLRPKGLAGRLPAVICPHGHVSGGKLSVAGVAERPEVAKTITDYNYDYGVQFARAGFLAFCPDARGFGERQEKETRANVLAGSCHHLQMMGEPLGIPVAGMWTFDLMRLADHVLARKDVRPGGLACAGLSGGGLQTLYFAAIDTRISCAVISGYFYGVRESLLGQPANCPCNIVPGLWERFDMGDIGAMIAPRPLLVETGDADTLNGASGVKNVNSQMEIARRAYKAMKAADRISHDVFPGGHRWHGTEAIPWVKKWIACH